MAINTNITYTQDEDRAGGVSWAEDPPTEDIPTSDEEGSRYGNNGSNGTPQNDSSPPTGGENEEPPILPVSGNVNFVRSIYSNSIFKDKIDSTFSELSSQDNVIDIEGFFKTYNRVFFDIPKEGNQSHTSIIKDSTEYVNNYIDPKDDVISNLENLIEDLERQIAELNNEIEESNQPDEHPFFKNGTLLKHNNHVYYMDKGYARRIDYNFDFFEMLKQTLYGTNTPSYPELNSNMFSSLKRGFPNLNQNNYSEYWTPSTFVSDTITAVEALLRQLDQDGMPSLAPSNYSSKQEFLIALENDYEEKQAQIDVLTVEINNTQSEINALLNTAGGSSSGKGGSQTSPRDFQNQAGNNSYNR